MKKIFMVLLLLPFTAVYSAQTENPCDKIESEIKNFEFKLNENNQMMIYSNNYEFLDIWKKSCETCTTEEGCENFKVKVPWGKSMWGTFYSLLMNPCRSRSWPVIHEDGDHKLARWESKCYANDCLLWAHYAYTLYKKIKKQIPWHSQPTTEVKRILEAFATDMSYEQYVQCLHINNLEKDRLVEEEKIRIKWNEWKDAEAKRLAKAPRYAEQAAMHRQTSSPRSMSLTAEEKWRRDQENGFR